MIAERPCESDGERHIPQPSALRCRHLPVPVGSLNADLPLAEIDVAPFERDHLAKPKTPLPTQEHDEVRGCIDRARRQDESLVLVRYSRIPGALQRALRAVCLDRDRRRHPGQGQSLLPTNFRDTTLAQVGRGAMFVIQWRGLLCRQGKLSSPSREPALTVRRQARQSPCFRARLPHVVRDQAAGRSTFRATPCLAGLLSTLGRSRVPYAKGIDR